MICISCEKELTLDESEQEDMNGDLEMLCNKCFKELDEITLSKEEMKEIEDDKLTDESMGN